MLRPILAGMGNGAIAAVELSRPPIGLGAPRARWLIVTVKLADEDNTTLAAWQAALVAGAYRDLARRQKLPAVVGYSVVRRRPGGRAEPRSVRRLVGDALSEPVVARKDALAARIRARIAELSTGAGGLRLRAIGFTRPLGPVPTVDVVALGDPRRAIAVVHRSLWRVFGDAEGGYLRLTAASGERLLEIGYATRSRARFLRVAERYVSSAGLGWPRRPTDA